MPTSLMETEPILQFFSYAHLPVNLQKVSSPFWDLAHNLVEHLPVNSERTAALKKLLEAKDCAVRALLFKSSYELYKETTEQ